MGRDKASAKTYSKIQIVFVNTSFSEALIFRISIVINPSKATMPRTMQKGINLGYDGVLSNESARAMPNRFKRHSTPKLKNAAFANMEKSRRQTICSPSWISTMKILYSSRRIRVNF